jgi:deoxyribonuclease-4
MQTKPVRTKPKIGAHVDSADPLTAAAACGAEVIQFFLTDPQSYAAPKPHAHADAIRAAAAASSAGGTASSVALEVYIHSPYRLNVATTNNRIRIPSRKLLLQHAVAAADLGAKGLIVHGGHVDKGSDLDAGFDNWRKTFAYAQENGGFPLPILIENTAGGDNAIARRFDALARLWDAIGEFGAGFCLDTCHAHAGGEELLGIVDRVMAITGRIDLVHANDSRDTFDSGADRHDNIGKGHIDPELIIAVLKAAGAPAVVETPAAGHASDIELLRTAVA